MSDEVIRSAAKPFPARAALPWLVGAGVYVLPQGGTDPQKPHREDEMYYVIRGRARMQIGSDHAEVRAGSVIFVEAELEHRFYTIQEELEVLVFFAPAEQE